LGRGELDEAVTLEFREWPVLKVNCGKVREEEAAGKVNF